MVKFPCQGCTARHLGCHDSCVPYKEACEENYQIKIARMIECRDCQSSREAKAFHHNSLRHLSQAKKKH